MKKFIRNILVLIIVNVMAVEAVSLAYVKLDREDSDYTNKFAYIPDKLQICNFGSSHGLYGYNYEDISHKSDCFNFALVSQTLSYDYRLFQNYRHHIDKGTVVFITISYFSLFGIPEINTDGFVSKNKRYYSILPDDLIKEYDLLTDLSVHYFPALSVDFFSLVKTLLGRLSDFNDENWQETALQADAAADAKAAYERHIVNNKYDDAGNRIVNEEEIMALYDLIEGCKEKGAIPILITTPYLREYTLEAEKNADGFFDGFYSVIRQVTADTGVEYYDYAFDKRFSGKYSWFMDSDHLNKEGARNFTDILMQEIVYHKGYAKAKG